MILKKQLRYVFCVLQILHVLAGKNSIELDGYDTTDNAARLLSLDFVEYTKTFKNNDAYMQSSTRIQDFSDETTTELDQNEHLLNDYLNSNDANFMLASSSLDVPILHFDEKFEPSFNSIDESNDRGITLPSDTENEQTMCNSTVPTDPVLSIERYSASKNEILFSWKITKKESNCILIHLKTTCYYVATNGYGYDIVNGSATASINSSIHNEFLIINSTVEDISPYTTYSCSAFVTNEAGRSTFSDKTNITTLEDIPSTPTFNVTNVTYSQFQIVWESPTYLPGSLQEFEVTLEWEEHFTVPDWCQSSSKKLTISFNATTLSFNYTEAVAYTDYNVKIRAKTNAGWGNYSDYWTFQTLPIVSDTVSNFSVSLINDENNPDRLDTILTWGFPCLSNGKIEYFNISVYGIRSNRSPHSFSNRTYVPNNVTKNDIFVVKLKELQAEYNYTIEVSVKVRDVPNLGIPVRSTVEYPAGIPFQPDEEYIKSITIDPSKARRSTTSATLLLPLFPDTNGDIIYYSIIVLKVDHDIASNTRYNFEKLTWPNISSWEESMLQDFTIPYQATRMYWDPYLTNNVADYGDVKAVKYTLGEDTNCEGISSNTHKRVYCNGSLKPNTWYHVRMRAFSRAGYADSTTFVIKTNAEVNIGLVSGVVFGILCFGILTTMMLLVRKCSLQEILQRFLHSNMSKSPVPVPFSKKKFIAHCQQFIDNPGKLSNEFQLLQTLSLDLQMPTNNACLQANKKKNRYSDILPYDFSRVKLTVIDNDPNTDYINASFIRGYTGEDEYIACQGPKEETTFDFWRMVEQYNINIIIMLTQLVEKGKEKCYQYFPTIREIFRYEDMTIKCISELDYRSYTQRTLVLQKENKKRHIIHLHFKDWPDHDVPEDFDLMIHFCQVIRRNLLANKGYIVIHCSAGIGRTGTLIAVDILLQHLRDNRKLDVFGTVYRLRHHRINMVQKESQYAYIYNCIKQVLKNPYCLKSYKPPPMDPLDENTSRKSKAKPNSSSNLVKNIAICNNLL
ncbi:phosphatidylinositol phosphatase PTPRQ-like isoform X2 [Lasioglossum baleicum]|uniref:phosphatidylinositol phosphatase PTPRQ-like isoform X2 n=1 Tax=Lasioglossum baleicum TaxID=434251 RepID=UPI003FCD48CA